jgi:hypothetical protein
MAIQLDPLSQLAHFSCPCSLGRQTLKALEGEAACSACGRRFPVRDGILEFVNAEELDAEKARELTGQTIELSPENIRRFANKDSWSAYRGHFASRKFQVVADYMRDVPHDTLLSLGSGFGFELKGLLPLHPFDRVFSSDLSFTKGCVVPHTLAQADVELCVFTSDLDECPFHSREVPVLVYEALHHTPDIHRTLELLLARGFDHLLLVEPITNPLLRSLERWGLSRRVESSGVKPGRLHLATMERLARSHGYTSETTTMWVFPDDYLGRVATSGGPLQRAFLRLLESLSFATRPIRFGNFAIVHLRRDARDPRVADAEAAPLER